jgi:hypothetical protein
MTLSKACLYIINFTSAHGSRSGLLDDDRLAYPENRVEADHRLSWLLGRLERAYGDSAYHVHLPCATSTRRPRAS